MSEISIRLRQERKRLSLSQREMGQLGGVAANAQGKYESGERIPRADYLAALASAGVDVLYVLTGRHAAVLKADDNSLRVDYPLHEPDALLVEVKHAAKHFLSTIEELSNNYTDNSKADRKHRNGSSNGAGN